MKFFRNIFEGKPTEQQEETRQQKRTRSSTRTEFLGDTRNERLEAIRKKILEEIKSNEDGLDIERLNNYVERLSFSHSEIDIKKTLNATDKSMRVIKKKINEGRIKSFLKGKEMKKVMTF